MRMKNHVTIRSASSQSGVHAACERCRRLVMNPAMLEPGQEVVLMSFPGRFRVIAVDGDVVTIENDIGVRKTVLEQSVRVMPPRQS